MVAIEDAWGITTQKAWAITAQKNEHSARKTPRFRVPWGLGVVYGASHFG